jgi:class 3 adenylate cyclase
MTGIMLPPPTRTIIMARTPTPPPPSDDEGGWRRRLASLRLRFPDPALEAAFREDHFHLNLGNVRFSFIAGIALWIGWGMLLRPHMLALEDQQWDMLIRYGVFIPMLVVGFALTYAPIFSRVWEWVCVAIVIATIGVWVFYASNVLTLPAEYGYIGVILITAFTYALLRLRFILVVLITLVGVAAYLPYAFTARYIVEVSRVLATLYLISFGVLGGMAAYWMERFTRQLFVRQRQLDEERQRSDRLLLNILPQAVVEQLKSSGERVAQAFDEVSVVFVDAVGSTAQAARSTPDEFAGALDALFRRFDEMADRLGLEKIKTIGDAYMAVAGAPVPAPDHAGSAVAMALEILADCEKARWPSGDPIVIRGGIATGPAVAGVIGERKFAYDVWGDTVNLASRLEEHGEPGQILVSEPTAIEVRDRYRFGPARVLDIKGKGPTPAHALLGPAIPSDEGEPSVPERSEVTP